MNATITLKELHNDNVRTVKTYGCEVQDPFESLEMALVGYLAQAHLEMDGERPAFDSGVIRYSVDVESHDGARNIFSGIATKHQDGIYRIEIGTRHG